MLNKLKQKYDDLAAESPPPQPDRTQPTLETASREQLQAYIRKRAAQHQALKEKYREVMGEKQLIDQVIGAFLPSGTYSSSADLEQQLEEVQTMHSLQSKTLKEELAARGESVAVAEAALQEMRQKLEIAEEVKGANAEIKVKMEADYRIVLSEVEKELAEKNAMIAHLKEEAKSGGTGETKLEEESPDAVARLESELAKAKSSMERAKSIIVEQDVKISALEAAQRQQAEELEALKSSRQEQDANHLLEAAIAERDQAEQHRGALEEEKATRAAAHEAIVAQLTETSARVAELEAQLLDREQDEDDKEELSEKIGALDLENAQLIRRIEKLEEAKGKATKAAQEAQEAASATAEDLQTARQALAEAEVQVEALASGKAHAEQDAERLAAQVAAAETAVREIKEELNDLQQERTALANALSSAKEDLRIQEIQEAQGDGEQALVAEIAKLKDTRQAVQDELAEAQAAHHATQASLDDAVRECKAGEEELKAMKAALADATRECEHVRATSKEMHEAAMDKHAETEEQHKRMLKEAEAAQGQLEEKLAHAEEKLKTAQQSKKQLKQVQKELKEAQRLLNEAEKRSEERQKLEAQRKEQEERSKARGAEQEAQCVAAEARRAEAEGKVDELQERLRMSEDEVKLLTKSIEDLHSADTRAQASLGRAKDLIQEQDKKFAILTAQEQQVAQDLASALAELNAERARGEQALQQKEAEAEGQMASRAQAAQTRVEALERDLLERGEQLEASTAETQSARTELREANSALDSARGELLAIQERLDELSSAHQEVLSRSEGAEMRLTKAKEEYAEVAVAAASRETSLREEVDRLQQQLVEVTAERDEHADGATEAHSDLSTVKEQLEAARAAATDAEAARVQAEAAVREADDVQAQHALEKGVLLRKIEVMRKELHGKMKNPSQWAKQNNDVKSLQDENMLLRATLEGREVESPPGVSGLAGGARGEEEKEMKRQYLKNVLLKFITSDDPAQQQLLPAVCTVLELSPVEAQAIKNRLEGRGGWKLFGR